MKKLFNTLFLSLLAAFVMLPISTQAADINNIGDPDYKLVTTADNSEVFVYAYNVMDYGAVADGVTDNTDIFQKLLNKVGDLGGGTVYVPTGKYVIRGTLSIPRGVVLRGDWSKPDKSKALPDGTILMAYTGRNGNERTDPFIEMCIETGLMDVTIWYPEQDPNNIVPYSPTIRYGFNNYFGNEYCNTNRVTLVNSYIGILFNYDNGGAAPVVNNLYGTTLKKGIEIDNIVDVGRIDGVNFSPDYWINSGYSNAPSNTATFKEYMKKNSTGIVMRRNDWSYTCNITVDGYMCGYDTEASLSDGATPNGHHYNFNFTDCTTGIIINATNSVGIMFDEINIKNCENGIMFTDNTSDAAQFLHTTIDASKYALRTSEKSNTKVMFNQSTVTRGQVSINGGTLISNGTAFNNKAPQIYFGLSGRGVITGCTFKETRQISNNSIYEISINDNTSLVDTVESFPSVTFDPHTPSRRVMYNATAAPYYASTSSNDNTTAIQNALNQASQDGGGIVFLPSGKYKVRGHLTIPSNVELRGALDIKTVPHGGGTILEAYENRGNESGDCFIQLKANAGIRAIVIDYPEQVFDGSDTWMPTAYPYTIQGQGDNVYVINTSVRASYKALDLFTYQCNNHYVDFLGGHVFNVGVKVGNNCENGKLFNLMYNVIVYACGNESKFGSFSNMPNGVSNARLYAYGLDYLDFMILGDCKNEILYNDFHYGSRHGIVFENNGNGGPSGASMGLGIDGSARSVYVKSGTTNQFDLYNTQIVSIVGSDSADTSYYQIDSNSNMNLNFYNADHWGQPNKGVDSAANNNTTLTIYGSQFQNPGQTTFAAASGGNTYVVASNLNQNGSGFVDSGSEGYISVYGSTVNNRDNSVGSFKLWNTNQNIYASISSDGILASINRNGWTATASNNTNNTGNALDGNIETRWDTAGFQVSGEWFTVNFGQSYTFNTLILDVGSSTNDGPASYEIYVSDDGSNWGSAIASGTTSNGIITFDTQTKRYVRVLQTGTKSGAYWSIHEFYALTSSSLNDLPNGEVSSEGSSGDSEDTTTQPPTTEGPTTTVATPCDLVITSIYTDKTYYAGEEAQFYATIKNNGNIATPSGIKHGLSLSVDGIVVNWCDTYFDSMEPGEEVVLKMNYGPNNKATWTVTEGTHTVSAMIDDQYLITESNENNNTFSTQITFDKEPDTTIVSNVQLEINGYQISTSVEGFRTVYTISDPDSEVVKAGMIYGIGDISTDNMVVGGTGVYNFTATDAGKLDASFSDLANAQSYSMTMQFAKTAAFYTSKMNVRVYAQLSDGTYVYSNVESFTVYEIADYLFQNLLMNSLDSHDYLYNNILTLVNPSYVYKDFAWNNSIVKPGDVKL